MPIRVQLDSHYGLIVLNRSDDGHVVVSGELIPTASIERIDGEDGRHSRLILDEERYDLLVSGGGFWRRARRAEVAGPTERWVFVAATRRSHRLARGPRGTESNEVGRLSAAEQSVTAKWRHVPGGAADLQPSPKECAMGYLLAASYGTGSALTLMAIFQGTVDVLVPG
jgi:hypothetical protein